MTFDEDIPINYTTSELIHYGCGPAAYAIFEVLNKPDSEVWFNTEVVDMETNLSTHFYIRAYESELKVGHGMCSGGFKFKKGGTYKVRFTTVNSNQMTLTRTDWIVFDSPYNDL